MEDSIFSFLGEKAEDDCTLLFLSTSYSAIISPHHIHLIKPPNFFSQENHKKQFLIYKIQTNGKVQLQLQLHSLSGPH